MKRKNPSQFNLSDWFREADRGEKIQIKRSRIFNPGNAVAFTATPTQDGKFRLSVYSPTQQVDLKMEPEQAERIANSILRVIKSMK